MPNTDYLSTSLPNTGSSRLASRRPQLTTAQCRQANIEIVNPKEEYDKIQKKHGPKGKISEQRISNGQVEMRIKSHLQLSQLEVYVQREPEADKKLKSKDPNAYGLGPTKLDKLNITQVARSNPHQEPLTYICKFDLDCVYKTPDNKEVYRLEKTKGTEYNRFQLKVYLQFVDGSHAVLFPYEFVLKSGKTVKSLPTTCLPSRPSSFSGGVSLAASSQQDHSDTHYSRLMCQHLEAEFSRIKFLEVEQIQTANHDIAYYIKRKYPDDSPFEEGDVVGFFESVHGETVIDLLTSENAHDARLAGVISRTAYLVGNTGRNDRERNDADLVCIIGEIKVKVVGKVRPGEHIYTCSSDKYPGTATIRQQHGNHKQTLLGYAMGESSGSGVSKVDCLVSLVLSVNARERMRELEQLRHSIKEVRENMEMHIDNVGHRINRMQRGWRGIWKKLLGIIIFLVLAALVCGLMLPPNSPYVKKKCREGSTDGRLYFKYYPEHSEDGIPVTGLEFKWEKLKKKLHLNFDKIQTNGTEYRYFLNKRRCETGGIRSIASWLDPAPTFPRVNVLAVDPTCKTVYYHNKKMGKWYEYSNSTVADVRCQP